jgi:hypothetical protein
VGRGERGEGREDCEERGGKTSDHRNHLCEKAERPSALSGEPTASAASLLMLTRRSVAQKNARTQPSGLHKL